MSNKSEGNGAERLIFDHLLALGFVGEVLETKMRMVRIRGRSVMVADKGTKLGDIMGILNGNMLLVEVKSHDEDLLQYSVLKKHQHESLLNWRAHGGLPMIGWVRKDVFRFFSYPLIWNPGESLPWTP